jgi:DNA modification methylase
MQVSELLNELGEIGDITRVSGASAVHNIHPYPAKYIAAIPGRIISEFTNERHVVLDPFCGSGTTLLEAKLLGRDSIGFDLNPVGVLIARVKTYSLTLSDVEFFTAFRAQLVKSFQKKVAKTLWVPPIPRIEHWFSLAAIEALGQIVDHIRTVQPLSRRRILNLVLSGIVTSVSNQESETRFASKPNDITADEILGLFLKKLDSVLAKLGSVANNKKFLSATSIVHLGNTLEIGEHLPHNAVDLIVTSPPYLNSFDYYLYHKFRVFWLSYPENEGEIFPVKSIQESEIGSRYKYSGPNGEQLSVFRAEMERCFTAFNQVLKPSKLMFLVVGDSIVKGEFLRMDTYYEEIGKACGFDLVSSTSYAMSKASKSFISVNAISKHFPNKETHILVFQSKNINKNSSSDLGRVLEVTSNQPEVIEVNALPISVVKGGRYFISAENVTSFTHGLAKYPAKYIPQIPEWAIKAYSNSGDLVLDPFNGSGTTAVECLLQQRRFIGVDINPVGVLASRVKTTYISSNVFTESLKDLKKQIAVLSKSQKFNRVDFDLQDFWFNPEVLSEVFLLKAAIDKVKDASCRDLMLLSLSSVIKKVSYLDESQLKVKRDPKKVLNGTLSPVQPFLARVERDYSLVSSLEPFSEWQDNILCTLGSAYHLDKLLGEDSRIDLIVTSPPYINAMNYPMYHRYEQLLLGLVEPDQYIDHQTEYIGTERVYAKDYRSFAPMQTNSSSELNKKLHQIFELEPKRYFIAKKYFDDMTVFLRQAYQLLKKGGRLVLVCGENVIKGVPIATSYELAEIGEQEGFEIECDLSYEIRKHRFKITRHKTAGKISSDTIIVLKK